MRSAPWSLSADFRISQTPVQTGRTANTRACLSLASVILFVCFSSLAAEEEPRPEGWRVLPVPLLVGTSDVGWGPAAILVATDNNRGYEPYKRQWVLAATRTNLGYEGYWLKVDSPRFPWSSVRLSVELEYSRNLLAIFRGYGNDINLPAQERIREGTSPSPSNLPASPTVFRGSEASLAQNCPSLSEATAGNPRCWNAGSRWLRESQNKYTAYDLTRRMAYAQLQGDFGTPRVKWQAGYTFQRMRVLSYQGDREGGNTVPEGPTLIDLQEPTGYNALSAPRLVNMYTFMVFYDSISMAEEVHPTEGLRAGIKQELAGPAAGSDYRFNRTSLLMNQYIPVGKPIGEELIFAWRLYASESRGDVPFFEEVGLGGKRLRGYPAQTFIDRVVAAGSGEIRWTFHRSKGMGLDLIALGFLDEGRVAHTRGELNGKDWHVARGAGIGLLFDRNSLLEFVYGRSLYESYAELSVGHTFGLL